MHLAWTSLDIFYCSYLLCKSQLCIWSIKCDLGSQHLWEAEFGFGVLSILFMRGPNKGLYSLTPSSPLMQNLWRKYSHKLPTWLLYQGTASYLSKSQSLLSRLSETGSVSHGFPAYLVWQTMSWSLAAEFISRVHFRSLRAAFSLLLLDYCFSSFTTAK